MRILVLLLVPFVTGSMKKYWWILLALLAFVGLLANRLAGSANPAVSEKINGVSLVAPPNPMDEGDMSTVNRVNANWVAVIPFGFSRAGQPSLSYNSIGQWWGERKEGAQKQIEYAKNLGLKVMLKPHVWVMGQGWPGDYTLETEEHWQTWEKDYTTFILDYAKLAQTTKVDLLCIGTEFRQVVIKRPTFWENLIPKIRAEYKGPITYAANWDNYENVTFWNQLDFIGIDGYFPIWNELSNPTPEALDKAWQPYVQMLKKYAQHQGKVVLFTEYGYQSIDYTAAGHYNIPSSDIRQNAQAQADAYGGLYRALWNEPWFGGGFLWKWFTEGDRHGRRSTGFTPQGKITEEVIAKAYQTRY